MGDRTFSVVAPKYWNELPDDIRNIELPLEIFKKKLKTHYFKITYYREQDHCRGVYLPLSIKGEEIPFPRYSQFFIFR